MKSFWFLTAARLATCFLPEAVLTNNVPQTSLHDFFKYDTIEQFGDLWQPRDSIKLDTGRLLIQKPSGSLYSKAPVIKKSDEWTVEVVFRSEGGRQDTIYGSTNGFSIFLVDELGTDQSNYGGPAVFDGLQLVVNAQHNQGLKIIVNDGTKNILNTVSQSIGGCDFAYLGSNVPTSIRVSYSKSKQWFKVQLDNHLCFKSDKIVVPLENLNLGVAGSIGSTSDESFEVFRINTWNQLTEDAVDDHGLISSGGIKVQVVDDEVQHPSAGRQSLMERANKLKEELAQQMNQQANKPVEEEVPRVAAGDSSVMSSLSLIQLDEIIKQNRELHQRFDKLEDTIKKLELKAPAAAGEQTLADIKDTVTSHYHEVLNSIASLNQKLIGEVREQQYNIEAIDKKVELLMANHKEIQHEYKASMKQPQVEHFPLPSLLRIVLIIIVIGILVLTTIVYRLRHDIKHSKLL